MGLALVCSDRLHILDPGADCTQRICMYHVAGAVVLVRTAQSHVHPYRRVLLELSSIHALRSLMELASSDPDVYIAARIDGEWVTWGGETFVPVTLPFVITYGDQLEAMVLTSAANARGVMGEPMLVETLKELVKLKVVTGELTSHAF